ncbi:MAG: lipoyl(octanoyl) transferase LipB [Bacteroidota bacterium]
MEKVQYINLGLIDYQEAWDFQTEKHKGLIQLKRDNREKEKEGLKREEVLHYLLFCEHPPVYTLGKSGSMENLLLNEAQLEEGGFQFYKINRGGDITYHGPGQIIGYPIFDLDGFFTDVHKYVRYLEEAVIRTLSDYGLEAVRMKDYTGVWMPAQDDQPKRKICAIGVHLSRWVSMHGFAFNVKPQLNHFNNIIPCGIADDDKTVTSLEKEIGRSVDIEEVRQKLKGHFSELFGFEFVNED